MQPSRTRRGASDPQGRDQCRWRQRGAALAAFAAFLATWAGSPLVARSEPVSTANVVAELVSEHETIRPGEPFTVGIALRPSPGWHTYWQNPGDSGLPTRVDWKLPPGFRAGALEWPHPVRLGVSPFVTFGYEADSLLLTTIDAPPGLASGSEADIVATARWLACREDACVPGKADLSLRIRVADSAPLPDSRWTEVFAAARRGLPRRIDGWKATASQAGDRIHIEVTAPADQRPSTTRIQVYPLMAGVMDPSSDPVVRMTDTGLSVDAPRDQKANEIPDEMELVLVADGGWDVGAKFEALRVDARKVATTTASEPAPVAAPAPGSAKTPPAAAAPVTIPAESNPLTLWTAVVLAFAGGIILNLMPCVFPVLSLKILGFIHVAHHDASVVRRHGYAFTAGVVVSFWILAGALLALRAAGGALGWGFQLQEPLFVASVAALLLAMALNLLGVFEFGASLAGAAGRLDSQSGYHGSFLSGVLATILATPCSAPFMGTAIGYALAQPATTSLAVFTALGAGMASPYLLLSCAPILIRRLPRPGAWMERFREAMAFPLLATVAWLVWVFGQQTGNDGVLALLMALLVGAMAAWVGGRFASGEGHAPARLLTAGLLAVSAFLLVNAASGERAVAPAGVATAHADGSAVAWQPWDPDAVARHRSEGRVVFVDFTADWCLSCKVNERVALSGDEFVRGMAEANAVAMKADWTSADPRITATLAAFGRSGVPLYVVYPVDPSREPIVLPQILTPAVVRDALARAVARA
jgi:thiol:disulfide interchange protein/DsbC/DsbD-like thiol-disulfide interchange protein